MECMLPPCKQMDDAERYSTHKCHLEGHAKGSFLRSFTISTARSLHKVQCALCCSNRHFRSSRASSLPMVILGEEEVGDDDMSVDEG